MGGGPQSTAGQRLERLTTEGDIVDIGGGAVLSGDIWAPGRTLLPHSPSAWRVRMGDKELPSLGP